MNYHGFTYFVFFIIFFNSCISHPSNSDTLHPQTLTCNGFDNPEGIETPLPYFNWISISKQREEKQTAFRVMVASNMDSLQQDIADLWDSRKVKSDLQSCILFNGKTLRSGRICYWKVKVWDKEDNESEWSSIATFTTGIFTNEEWQGKWISNDQSSINAKSNLIQACYFRKDFISDKKIAQAIMFYACQNHFEIYINGLKVGNEVLSTTLTSRSNSIGYLCHDVTSMLKTGKNSISAVLGRESTLPYINNDTSNLVSGNLALLLQVNLTYSDGTTEKWVSDKTWKFTSKGPIVNGLANELYDARNEISGWDMAGYDDRTWDSATILNIPVKRIGLITDEPSRVYEKPKAYDIFKTKNNTFIFDFGIDIIGWAHLKIKGRRGTTVNLTYCEDSLNSRYKTKIVDSYTLKGEGIEEWEPKFTLHKFRYIELSGYPGIPDLSILEGRIVRHDVIQTGKFECIDSLLCQLFKKNFWATQEHINYNYCLNKVRPEKLATPIFIANLDQRYKQWASIFHKDHNDSIRYTVNNAYDLFDTIMLKGIENKSTFKLFQVFHLIGGLSNNPGYSDFKYFTLQPALLSCFDHINYAYNSSFGLIISDWKIERDVLLWKISIPVNTLAIIKIPASNVDAVWEGSFPAKEAEGLKYKKCENGYVVFEAGSGDYSFKSAGFRSTFSK